MDGIFTREIYKEALRNGVTEQDFRDNLDEYSPTNNLEGLSTEMDIDIVLGVQDRVVPYRDGKLLVREMKKRGLKPRVKHNILYDHSLTITRFRNGN